MGREKKIDETGKRYGLLTVVRESHVKQYKTYWECLCDCGMTVFVQGDSLRSGNSKSCGCRGTRPPNSVPPGTVKQKQSRANGSRRGYSGFYRTYLRYRGDAQYRGLEFCITQDEFRELTQSNCHYCGVEPSQVVKDQQPQEDGTIGTYTYNGIDRIDSKGGYTHENIVPCCRVCNTAKSDMPEAVFLGWVRRIASHQGLCELTTAA